MKILIAAVMFLLGVFIGILAMTMFREFSQPFSMEEEYSTPRIKTILHDFGVTLPLEASNVNLFLKKDGEKKRLWVKFECPSEVKDAFVEQLGVNHQGRFNYEVELPKMLDGSAITWWTNQDSFRVHEFSDLRVSYDDVLRNLYIYAVSDIGQKAHAPEPAD